MKTIKTLTQTYYNSDHIYFDIPAYSKLLNVLLDNGMFIIIYEYDNTIESTNTKNINFGILTDVNFTFNEYGYEYYKTIIDEDPPILSNYSNGSQINLTIIPSNKKYFHIFVQEIKPLDELRDFKLEKLLE